METKIWTYLRTHLFYVVLIGVSLLFFHSWLVEHDNKLLAQQQLKISELRVQDLAQQNQAIKEAAQRQVVVVQKTVAAVKTPTDAVAVIPTLTTVPIQPQLDTAHPNLIEVDPIALVKELGQCKQDSIQLDACTKESANKDAIIVEKDTEIKALKKPQGFWKRLKGTTKVFGIGVGVGIALVATHIL